MIISDHLRRHTQLAKCEKRRREIIVVAKLSNNTFSTKTTKWKSKMQLNAPTSQSFASVILRGGIYKNE